MPNVDNMIKLLTARGGQKIEMNSFSPWQSMKGPDFSNSAQEVGHISLNSSNKPPAMPVKDDSPSYYI